MVAFAFLGMYLEAFQVVQSLTHHHKLSYNTIFRMSQTPGNRVVYFYTNIFGKAPKSACGMCLGWL